MIRTIVGDNVFELKNLRKKYISDFVIKYGDFSLEIIDAEEVDVQRIYDGLTNLPFLSTKKLLVIDNPSKNKLLTESLVEWLKNIGDNTEVLIVDPSADKRTIWYKYLVKSTQLVDCRSLDKFELKKWIVNYAMERKGTISNDAVERILQLVGFNQLQISNELDKLLNYNPMIDLEEVNKLVDQMPQDTVFDMLDALANGQNEKVNQLYEDLQKAGIHSAEILAMINWQLTTLALIKSASKSGDISMKTGLHRFVVQKNSPLASRLTMCELESLIKTSLDTEVKIKRLGLNDVKAIGLMLSRMQVAYK